MTNTAEPIQLRCSECGKGVYRSAHPTAPHSTDVVCSQRGCGHRLALTLDVAPYLDDGERLAFDDTGAVTVVQS